jgi:Transposase DDE domain group 1
MRCRPLLIVSSVAVLVNLQRPPFLGALGAGTVRDKTTAPLAVHDPAKVLLDLAIALALGGDCLADVAGLRAEPGMYGLVASDPTVSRTIDALATDASRALAAINAARAQARARVWSLAGDDAPDHDTDAAKPLVVDLDATLVTAHRPALGRGVPARRRGLRRRLRVRPVAGGRSGPEADRGRGPGYQIAAHDRCTRSADGQPSAQRAGLVLRLPARQERRTRRGSVGQSGQPGPAGGTGARAAGWR